MLTETLLDRIPLGLLFAGTVLLLLAGGEIGYRLGAWQRARRPDGDRAPTNTIMGSTLGLLAFILAFTFGMSSSRYDTRRQLVLDEASAILKAFQRARSLPEPQGSGARQLLREYVALRTRMPTLERLEDLEPALRESERLQDALWAQATALADRPGPLVSAFMQSLSELVDLQMKRVRAAVWNRIPTTIVVVLYSIAFLGLATMGYNTGLSGSRTLAPAFLLVLAFSTVIVLIVDLERPRQTLFHVSQEPLADVSRRIQATPDPGR